MADLVKPVIDACPLDVSADLAYESSVSVNWIAPTATDNSGTVNLVSNYNPGDQFSTGTKTVSYTATDEAGNSSVCSFIVTVVDASPPVIVCPSDISVDLTSGTVILVNWEGPAAIDNSGIANIVSDHASGDAFSIGTTTVSSVATDGSGNNSSCSFIVTVIDKMPPEFDNCPVDISVEMSGTSTIEVSWLAPTSFDNGGNTNLVSDKAPGDFFSAGTTTVTYTSADDAGNVATCSFDVTVVDVTSVRPGTVPEIGVYPNPSEGNLIYLNPGNIDTGMLTVDIISLDGKILMNQKLNYRGSDIPVAMNLKSGIYQVRITGKDGITGFAKIVVF